MVGVSAGGVGVAVAAPQPVCRRLQADALLLAAALRQVSALSDVQLIGFQYFFSRYVRRSVISATIAISFFFVFVAV